MTKKLIKAKVEANADDTATAEGGDSAPLDNVGRLRTHLNADSLALKLLTQKERIRTGKAPSVARTCRALAAGGGIQSIVGGNPEVLAFPVTRATFPVPQKQFPV
jgi:hypothetical protein